MPGYISEIDYYGGAATEWVEIAIPAGTDVSGYTLVLYDDSGHVEATLSLGTVQNTIAGNDVYLVDSGTAGWSGLEHADGVALVDDTSTVLQFISYENHIVTAVHGPANGMTSVNAGIGAESEGQSLQTDDGGATYYVQTTPNPGTIPCYAPETLIDTKCGPRPVETLGIGDLVMTLDRGPQPIRWTRSRVQLLDGVPRDDWPVRIRAGALGPGCPYRDLVVSPQHRILLGAGGQLERAFDDPMFGPAKALTALPGIGRLRQDESITWVHFALPGHDVVRANGCLSESLFLSPMVLRGVSYLQRRALVEMYDRPGDGEALNGPLARPSLSVGALRRRIEDAGAGSGRLPAKADPA